MNKTFNVWENIYHDYDLAKKDSLGEGFHGEIYKVNSNKAHEITQNALDTFVSIPIFNKQRTYPLPFICAMILKEKFNLNILDFGGGLGIGYQTLCESFKLDNFTFNYDIVELNEVVNEGKR